MTYKEKLIKDRPDLSENQIEFIVREYCPDHCYVMLGFHCPNYWTSLMEDCKKCWNREAPDDAEYFPLYASLYAPLQESALP